MTSIVPVFPLPGVFLFPGQILPLHVFEPRYRDMVEDLLDGPGRLVMGTILDEQPDPEPDDPVLLPVAGLGEIARHNKLPDGRFGLLVFGLSRVRIDEVPSQHAYRLVEWTPWEETPPDDDTEAQLRPALRTAIEQRTGFAGRELEDASAAHLTDVLAQCLTIAAGEMEDLYAEPRVTERAERVLAAHGEQPVPRRDDS